jgi:uncharacterized protein Usg
MAGSEANVRERSLTRQEQLRESTLGCWLWQNYDLSPDKLVLVEYITPQGDFRQLHCSQPFAVFQPFWQRRDVGVIVAFTYRLEPSSLKG